MGIFDIFKKQKPETPSEVSQPISVITSPEVAHFAASIISDLKQALSYSLISSSRDLKRALYSKSPEPVYFTLEESGKNSLSLICKGSIPDFANTLPEAGNGRKLATLLLKPEGIRISISFIPELAVPDNYYAPKSFTFVINKESLIKSDIAMEFSAWLNDYFNKHMMNRAR